MKGLSVHDATVPLKGIVDAGGIPRRIGAPRTKFAVPIDGPAPLT